MDDHDEPRARRRKDRLIQTRVPEDLESTLKREARRRRLTVSHLIRNILEDTFQLVDDVVANVDDIVNDSVELARRVGRDARRVAGAVREAVNEPAQAAHREGEGDEPPDLGAAAAAPVDPEAETDPDDGYAPLAHVYAWNRVVLNRSATCARCSALLARGSEGLVGLSDEPGGPRVWLCTACSESL
jgi:hypothetical protein